MPRTNRGRTLDLGSEGRHVATLRPRFDGAALARFWFEAITPLRRFVEGTA